MSQSTRHVTVWLGWLAIVLLVPTAVSAKNHLWRFTEIYSNADGTLQFIEMQECCGSDVETRMASTSITSNTATYAFPNHLTGPTAFRWLLIATQGFADLPGAPTPDYIMPDGFFDPEGDTLGYRAFTDQLVLAPGALPTDGVLSLHRDLATMTLSVATNSPTNFAGDEGSVTPPPAVSGATLPWALVALALALIVASSRLTWRAGAR